MPVESCAQGLEENGSCGSSQEQRVFCTEGGRADPLITALGYKAVGGQSDSQRVIYQSGSWQAFEAAGGGHERALQRNGGVIVTAAANQNDESAQAKLRCQLRALQGLELQKLSADPGACVGQGLSPAVILVEGNAVVGDDGAAFGLHGDVSAPFQLGQRFA